MEAAYVRSGSNAVGAAGTSFSVSLGGTPTSGNFLIMVAAGPMTLSTPSGWTAIAGLDGLMQGAWKVSNGTETSVAVSYSGAAQCAAIFAEFSGVDAGQAPFTVGVSTGVLAADIVICWDMVASSPYIDGNYFFSASGSNWTYRRSDGSTFDGVNSEYGLALITNDDSLGSVSAPTCTWHIEPQEYQSVMTLKGGTFTPTGSPTTPALSFGSL